jgi:predicted nucleic acid-binding protein
VSAGWLIDTSVLSMLAPGKPPVDAGFATWLRSRSETLFISAITVAEIEQGLCKLRRAGGLERAGRIEAWLEQLIAQAPQRILPVDARVARQVGQMSDEATAAGRHPGLADVAIAATASAHDLTVLTRNVRHFVPLGVRVEDPAQRLPD